MISEPLEQIKSKAGRWIEFLGQGDLVEGKSTVGGGSLPGETLPTWLIAFSVRHPNKVLSSLREAQPPIIARLKEDRLVLDPRTVLANQEKQLMSNLQLILSSNR
jgi:L-seryl-tRNA(Ser) seleniumtransferase